MFNNFRKIAEKELTQEVRILTKMAKSVLDRKIFRKIKSIEEKERLEILKHSIKSFLDFDFKDLENKIRILKDKQKDLFFIEIKLKTLKMKLNLFHVTFSKKDFNSVTTLFKEIKKEIKNV